VAARHRMAARATGAGHRLSRRCRKKPEDGLGWLKGVAGLARRRVVGRWKIRQLWEPWAAAYNLVRMRAPPAAAGGAGAPGAAGGRPARRPVPARPARPTTVEPGQHTGFAAAC
jgi:hypothetical protein